MRGERRSGARRFGRDPESEGRTQTGSEGKRGRELYSEDPPPEDCLSSRLCCEVFMTFSTPFPRLLPWQTNRHSTTPHPQGFLRFRGVPEGSEVINPIADNPYLDD